MKNLINILLYVLLALLVVTISVMIYKKFKAPADTAMAPTEQVYSDTSAAAMPLTAEDSTILGLTGELPTQVGPESDAGNGANQENIAPVAKPVANHTASESTATTSTASTHSAATKAEGNSNSNTHSETKAAKAEASHAVVKTETKAESKAKKENKSATATKAQATNASKGHFYVISGSFLVPGNCDKQVAKLKKIGFFNATKKVFANSSSYSAIAGQYESEAAARASLNKLKSKGEEGFIKKI
ncbi:MAG: SPOR domain-containing protein [Saprospiraceae bacterium]|nr:SPOR domain-containing protein [Saprospiraceae bacterium]HMW37878.1 SPOR domain-containing protein [Saprospiraceae bacterium]HMX87378.1 SPOR domain-containing protein [Saprospiraceae bacterium]HMZ39205.1 SPOR domain-containing protein [Saprospiraceae bacterium]HNA63496.1 SPOR domain-containing protein [Saprospiraceae bacterium]